MRHKVRRQRGQQIRCFRITDVNALDAKLGEAADSGLESRQPKAESQQTYIQWERSQMGLKQGDTSQLKPTAGRVVKGQPLPLHRWPSVTNWYILLTSNAGICGCVSKSGHFPAKPPLNIREIDQSIRFSIFIFTHTHLPCVWKSSLLHQVLNLNLVMTSLVAPGNWKRSRSHQAAGLEMAVVELLCRTDV